MNKMLRDVAAFHEFYDAGDLEGPGVPAREIYLLRRKLIEEELDEYFEAACEGNTVEVLDALCDLAYILMGTVLVHGMGDVFDEAFAEVHRSNMSKFPNGVALRRADGKVIKPESWSPPNLAQFVGGGDS